MLPRRRSPLGRLREAARSIQRRKAMTMCGVPFREIALSGEPPFHVYDTSGPYTDADAKIDVKRGLPPLRAGLDRCARRWSGDAARVRPRRDRHQGDGVYRPSREYRSRAGRRGGGSSSCRRGELRRVDARLSSRRSSCAARSRAAAPSSPPISIILSLSR